MYPNKSALCGAPSHFYVQFYGNENFKDTGNCLERPQFLLSIVDGGKTGVPTKKNWKVLDVRNCDGVEERCSFPPSSSQENEQILSITSTASALCADLKWHIGLIILSLTNWYSLFSLCRSGKWRLLDGPSLPSSLPHSSTYFTPTTSQTQGHSRIWQFVSPYGDWDPQ